MVLFSLPKSLPQHQLGDNFFFTISNETCSLALSIKVAANVGPYEIMTLSLLLFTDNVLENIVFIYCLWHLLPFMSLPPQSGFRRLPFHKHSVHPLQLKSLLTSKPKWTSSQYSHPWKDPQWDALDSSPLRCSPALTSLTVLSPGFPSVSLTGLFQAPS